MITVRETPFSELVASPNFQELHDEYANESGLPGLPAPKAHIDSYLVLESTGMMKLLCAYLNDEIIGVAIVLVSILPHYGIPIATMESFFVAKGHRKTNAGHMLRIAAEDIAKDKSSPVLLISAAINSKLEKIMEGIESYQPTHTIFMKVFE